jgi:signal transduction histidine kinase
VRRSAPPRPWTLRRRIGQTFAVVGGVLLLLTGALVVSAVNFVSTANKVVYRWDPAVVTAQRLFADLVDQQSSVRGYALSHDANLVARYRSYLAAERRAAARLGSLLGGDADLRDRLSAVEAAAHRWQQQVAEPALRGIAAGEPSALRLMQSPRATQLFDAVRVRTTVLSSGIQQRSDAARGERRDFGAVLVVAISLAALVTILLGFAVWRGLHRWVLGPVDRLGAQTREVARGDTYRQIVPAGPLEVADLGRDVEAMRLQIAGQLARAEEIQDALRQRTEELVRSNDDLQQFAYVASHDLSEPLRKVANFCQLLERQYRDQLDDRAKQYIDFAVDGAKRMQALIADLLALSRVGRTTDEFVPVDLGAVLDAALATLGDRIAEAGARIERRTSLPTVSGDPTLLTSLMENLVGNAVKYRRPDAAPVVEVAAERNAAERTWTVTVSDNGIGIDPQYAERVFAVFQRLHVRDAFGGTGIGLAICRRIVEFHGGRIWLEPVQSSRGATFRFVLPEGGVVAQSRD